MKFFYNAQSFCDHLAKLFKRVTPIAGKGILIEDTDNGKRISCTVEPVTNSGSASNEYNGYFKVINTGGRSAPEVAVVDGADAESAACGYVTAKAGTSYIRIAVEPLEFEITASCSIYLEIDLLALTAVVKKAEPSMPSWPANKWLVNLASVFLDDDDNMFIYQIHKTGEIYIEIFRDVYNGPFAIRDTSGGETKQVTVCNGANPADPVAGYINHGGLTFPVAPATFPAAGAHLFLFLRYSDGEYSCGIVTQAELVADDLQYASVEIGYANVSGNFVPVYQYLKSNWTTSGRVV